MSQLMSSDLKLTLGAGLIGSALLTSGTTLAAENLRMSTLGPGTSPYIVMNTFATIVNDQVDGYSIQVNATGAATRHAVETAQGRSDFFMTSPFINHMMSQEIGPYANLPNAGELYDNLRAVLNFPLGYYHGVTFADSGITSYDDIKGQRVFLGPPGGAAYQIMELLIEGLTGYEAGEDYSVVSLGWDAASQSFQDGHIDVYFNPTLPPSPIITQMALSRDIRLLAIPEDRAATPDMQNILERPGFRLDSIPAGVYGDRQVTEGEVMTLASTVGIVTNQKLGEDVVYKMVKAFWEGLDEKSQQIPLLANISLEDALLDLNMPLHPGAEKYYRELGVSVPEIN
ncbi:TAXI family TRAP transporter solute-binding subunit [Halomonas alkalicola]|uniref:TAXI family TRAP transporter solute-binding subunit n=1 Tax=Halomonas alkalicola TaxID=1930622 RepID=UPI00265F8BA9|nr:TAXI family TRAP transporter solute-binding subunit [Halomonas alkalicola]